MKKECSLNSPEACTPTFYLRQTRISVASDISVLRVIDSSAIKVTNSIETSVQLVLQ
jgi:hypothetical protein